MSGGFEEKLNSILNDQQAMGQIMALAQSLSGGQNSGESGEAQEGDFVPAGEPEEGSSGPDNLGLEGLDPALVSLGMRLLGDYNRRDDRAQALLLALRPFLKQERWQKVDRAVSIARLSRVATALLRSLGNGGGQDV